MLLAYQKTRTKKKKKKVYTLPETSKPNKT